MAFPQLYNKHIEYNQLIGVKFSKFILKDILIECKVMKKIEKKKQKKKI